MVCGRSSSARGRGREGAVSGVSVTALRLFRQFYCTYPQIRQTLSDELLRHKDLAGKKAPAPIIPPQKLLSCLTFSHFVELLKVDDPLQRVFYEVQSIKGNWAVRDLKRNIGSLLYGRTALSRDKRSVLKKLKSENPVKPEEVIREPYILDFLGLPERKEYSESVLEGGLISHLQGFLMELGRGFCFEARQKRITVNNQHYYIDLVFYHRILKCHVIIDLKSREFTHADAGQMNFYLNYFRHNEMEKGDNPPVGLLLCTHNDQAEVQYATEGLPNKLFVSRYMLQLPSEKELVDFIRRDVKRLAKGK
jgi:predicted nuclease of restriction endonuclease-like (RecB) superfamily